MLAAAQDAVLPLPNAREINQTVKLFNSDDSSPGHDLFGRGVVVSADGNTLLIGATGDENQTTEQGADAKFGSVNIYVRSGSAWVKQAEVFSDTQSNNDEFSKHLSITPDGNIALIGENLEDYDGFTNSGVAHVFVRDGAGDWTRQTKLLNPDPASNDQYGKTTAVSDDGNIMLVAAVGEEGYRGAVYYYKYDGVTWAYQNYFVPASITTNERFGIWMEMSGDGTTVLVGASADNDITGSAFVFTRDGDTWTEQEYFQGENPGDEFGLTVSLSEDGNTAIVGAQKHNGSRGAAYLYARSGDTWTEQGKLTSPSPQAGHSFGAAVSVNADGSTAVVGAPGNASSPGKAYIYRRNGTTWSLLETLVASNGVNGNQIGAYAALFPNENTVAIGAPGDDILGTNAGAVYIFDFFTDCDEVTTVPTAECNALVGLYDSTSGPSWVDNQNWKQGGNPCAWAGITCTANQVTSIVLPDNNLVGTLPTQLSSLTGLEVLDLKGNQLTGTLPTQITAMSSLLELDLCDNGLEGSFTLGISLSLQTLRLCRNDFTGALPSSLTNATSLTTLDLSSNAFAGEVSAGFNNLIALAQVDLGYNALFATDAALNAFIDSKDADWETTQTAPPTNLALSVAPATQGLRVSWTPIAYTADGGYSLVSCSSATVSNVSLSTADKSIPELVFNGLPDGTYTCAVNSFTPAHALNNVDLLSETVTSAPLVYDGSDQPINDDFVNPIVFTGYPQQDYSFNIKNAERDLDPANYEIPPTAPGCGLSVPNDAGAIHYVIPGTAGGSTGGAVVRAGGPGWYKGRNLLDAADTAVVAYEVAANGDLTVVGCADDNGGGDISVSNVLLNLDPSKQYRVVVWNEGDAPNGAVIELAQATFSLITPGDGVNFAPATIPTEFRWETFDNPDLLTYTLAVGYAGQTPFSVLRVVELTPDAADNDGLVCSASECVLNVSQIPRLSTYLGAQNGQADNFLWSVSAKIRQPTQIDPDNTTLLDSNQVYRFGIGATIPTITPTSISTTAPTPTPTSTSTPSIIDIFGDFEDAAGNPLLAPWTGTNLTDDKVKCNKDKNGDGIIDKFFGYGESKCAFQFKGSAGENSSLTLLLPASSFTFEPGDEVQLSTWVMGKTNLVTKITARLKYQNDNALRNKIILPSFDLADYTEYRSDVETVAGDVVDIKVKIKFKSTTGKMLIDNVQLTVNPGMTASDGVLPLPPSQ